MAAISLKHPEDLLKASGQCADSLRLTRAEYMRRALEQMNRETRGQVRARRLRDASRRVRGESMKVNEAFAAQLRAIDNYRLVQGPLARLAPQQLDAVGYALLDVLELTDRA